MVKPPEVNVVKLRINAVEERLVAYDVCTRMGTRPATSDAFGVLCDEPNDSGFVLPAQHLQKLATHRVSGKARISQAENLPIMELAVIDEYEMWKAGRLTLEGLDRCIYALTRLFFTMHTGRYVGAWTFASVGIRMS